MEEGEEIDIYNDVIDDFYIVDSWSDKTKLSKKDRLSRRNPTEDVKGSQFTNGPCESTTMESSSHQLRRGRSRSPYASSMSRYPPVRENIRFPPREGGKNHSHLDTLRNDRNSIHDRRYHDDLRRHRRSRSRSRDKKHHRRRSYEHRSSLSLSPPPKRESGNQSSMEPRQAPPYYPNPRAVIPPNSSFMNPNPNLGLPSHGPVQYPIHSVSSNSSYGRYPGYNVPANNLFNSSHPQPHSFQPQMPQNQYPVHQNYNLYNPVMQGNPPNSVPYPTPNPNPAPWNQSSAGFNQNYSVPNVSTDAVMYPHLKIGQSRADSYKSSKRESLGGSPPQKQSKSSLEKRIHSNSRSPDPKKNKRKGSKRRSKSPSLDRKFEDIDKRYSRHSKSPVKTFRYDSKKPKVIIDPNRIPTPPPPPIVGSYKKDELKKSVEPKGINVDEKSDVNPLSDFLNKEKVSLSCLLEAVMETSGQGKSQLSDPKVKKEIISNCESKIQHLYKKRMSGLGAFIPDPVQSSRVIAHISPLIKFYSHFTYNCEEENNEWHCPDIIVPEVKLQEDVKVPVNNITTSQLPSLLLYEEKDSHLKTNVANPSNISRYSSNQSLPESNWNANNPDHLSQNTFPNAYKNNQQNIIPPHQSQQGWNNPVPPQNAYSVGPLMPGPEYSTLAQPSYMQPSYPFPHRPPAPQFMSQHSYPPQPGMLNFPTRMNYPPVHPFPPQNLNHPGMFSASQPDLNRSNYQYKADETHKVRKNKNMVNDNLILLSAHSGSKSDNAQKAIKGKNQNNIPEDMFNDDRDTTSTNNPKDKLLRKVWRLRKSSEYEHGVIDLQGTKEPQDGFYNKLNYAEMLEDTQIDTIHDYQLTNLRERIETCLAEGKISPGHSQRRSRDRREGDRDRDRHKDRERGRDKDRHRRGSLDGERKWHGRSPPRKSKEPSDKKDHSKISGKDDVIEILSDEEQSKHKLSESGKDEGLEDLDDHLKPSEKILASQIFDSLGPEIRKIQEKSDLYKSIISSLDKGDKAYKRIYSFRNHALMKCDKDFRKKMVIPRDNLKEIVTLIHKSIHHVQSEELSRLLKNICYPYMLYIPKCISKVMNECPLCIEEKKKNDDPLIDKKSDKTEKKSGKKNNRSLKDRDKDRRDSPERYKKISKDRSSSSLSKGRRDPLRSGREKDKKNSSTTDGRPSGYEKATKVRKPDVSSSTKSDQIAPDKQCQEEKCDVQIDVMSSELLHGLSDKALEFKNIPDSVTDVSEARSNIQISQKSSALDEKDYERSLACSNISKNDLERQDPKVESSNLFTKAEMESFNVAKPEMESSNIIKMESSDTVTKSQMESSNSVTNPGINDDMITKPKMKFSGTVTEMEMKSSSTATRPKLDSSNTGTKSEIKSFNAITKTEIESLNTGTESEKKSSNAVSITETESSYTGTKSKIESSNTKTEMESSVKITDSQDSKVLANCISQSSNFFVDQNHKPNESSSDTGSEVNIQNSRVVEDPKENNFRQEKSSLDKKVPDIDSSAPPKLDFKGRVRQVQMSSNECKNVMKALELRDDTIVTDPSYLIKGGMLCRKDSSGSSLEVKIVTPSDELEKVVNIVHTMSAVHTPPAKMVAFFSKHFTQVENLDLKVNEIVGNCSYCKLKSS
ncbi:uncharacterized protein [Halyomorpha halys]|uniref:uncharacterized protein isoform X2 n=1 Tax=Halyomorpha halys TaxID=286706 RepID=UPI0006D52740|nr:uncharacterized protein LOC106684177 isoform X2 [Halyomorpha halys]